MKLPDVNVLIYAHNSDSEFHAESKLWLEKALSGHETVAFASVVLLAFLRLTTRTGIFPKPMSVADAFRCIDSWLAMPNAVILHPGNRHWQLLQGLLVRSGTGGNLTTDAHLASLAIEHGATLVSFDHDFGRFPALDWICPE